MKLLVFSIYDSKAEGFITPFFMPKIGQATRVFNDCCNDKTHQFFKNPGDYTLFEIGEFDDEDGGMTMYDAKKSLGNGLKYRQMDMIGGTQKLNTDLYDPRKVGKNLDDSLEE